MTNDSQLMWGVVVAGSGDKSDPQAGGRVKVHVPNIHNPNKNSIDDLPWIPCGHEASGFGPLGNARPPAIGKTVLTLISEGMHTTHCIPISAINNQLSSDIIATGKALTPGIINDAMNHKHPNRSGPPKFKQVALDNSSRGSSVQGVTIQQSSVSEDVPMKDKREINSNEGANPGTVHKYKTPKNIATAIDAAHTIMTPQINALLPGVSLNLVNLLDMFSGDLMQQLEDVLSPEHLMVLQNMAKNSGVIEMSSGVSGYTQDTNNVNPATFALNAITHLKTVTNKADLFTALSTIQTSDDIKDLSSISLPNINLNGPFGSITIQIGSDGTITAGLSSVAQLLQNAFGLLTSGIPSAGGDSTFQSGSELPGKLLNRLPIGIQSDMKSFFERVAGTNNTTRARVETTISTLKGKLQ